MQNDLLDPNESDSIELVNRYGLKKAALLVKMAQEMANELKAELIQCREIDEAVDKVENIYWNDELHQKTGIIHELLNGDEPTRENLMVITFSILIN